MNESDSFLQCWPLLSQPSTTILKGSAIDCGWTELNRQDLSARQLWQPQYIVCSHTFRCLVEIQTEETVCGGEAGPVIHVADGKRSPEREDGSPPVHQHPKINTRHISHSHIMKL